MATAGQDIKKAHFSGSWAHSWSDSHSNKDQTRYVYLCCPVWYVVCSATYAAFGGSGVFQIRYSHWTGSEWSSEFSVECGAKSGNITLRAGHNRDEGNLNDHFHSNYPIWRIRYWPSRNNSRWKIALYAGGWGVAHRNYPTGKFIRSRGIAGASNCIYYAGTTNNPSYVINERFNPNNRRGSLILASDDSELNYFPYMG